MEFKRFALSTLFTVTELVCVFSTPFFKNHANPAERHNFWEMIYCSQGALVIEHEDHTQTVLKEGQALFHKPMEYHKHIGNPNNDSEIYVFSFNCTDEKMKHFEDLIINLNTNNLKTLRLIMSSIRLSGIEIDDTVQAHLINRLKIYSELLLIGIYEQINDIGIDTNHYMQAYNSILHLLHLNIYAKISLKDIARLSSMSESNVKKIWNMYSDISIMSYYNNLKLIEAKKMLLQGMSVGNIAEKLSFSSQSYFTVFFKRETGMSPTEYIASQS